MPGACFTCSLSKDRLRAGASFDTPFRQAQRLLRMSGSGFAHDALRSGPWALPPRELLNVVDIGAPDALLAAVGEACGPVAGLVSEQAGDRVAPQDHRAMDANEQRRIEILLELGDRAVDQPGAGADMEPHIIALGGDAVDVRSRDPHQAI